MTKTTLPMSGIDALDTDGKPYKSRIGHCWSCLSEAENGYGPYQYLDEPCCCTHAIESSPMNKTQEQDNQ